MLTTRRHRSASERDRIFEMRDGVCHCCGGEIDRRREAWQIDHRVPLGLGGEDDDQNLELAHVKCHARKTVDDLGIIAKAKRVRNRFLGNTPPPRRPLPGSKASFWRKRIDGTVERRDPARTPSIGASVEGLDAALRG